MKQCEIPLLKLLESGLVTKGGTSMVVHVSIDQHDSTEAQPHRAKLVVRLFAIANPPAMIETAGSLPAFACDQKAISDHRAGIQGDVVKRPSSVNALEQLVHLKIRATGRHRQSEHRRVVRKRAGKADRWIVLTGAHEFFDRTGSEQAIGIEEENIGRARAVSSEIARSCKTRRTLILQQL